MDTVLEQRESVGIKDFDLKSLASSLPDHIYNTPGVSDSHFQLADSDASQMSKPSYLQYKFRQERKMRRKMREQLKGPTVPVERQPIPQIFTPAAQRNAYYICHNAAEMLKVRGFPAKEYPPVDSPDEDSETE